MWKNIFKKDVLIIVFSVLLAIAFIAWMVYGLNSNGAKEWLKQPFNKLTAGDILIIAIIHAVINRSDCKKEK